MKHILMPRCRAKITSRPRSYLFFPRHDSFYAARSKSFSASWRNLCVSGGADRTASIS
jgi:hypothetical protein